MTRKIYCSGHAGRNIHALGREGLSGCRRGGRGSNKGIENPKCAAEIALNLFPDISKLDGLVIKSRIIFKRHYDALGNPGKTVGTLISAKVQQVDDSELQVPAGYTEEKDPDAATMLQGLLSPSATVTPAPKP